MAELQATPIPTGRFVPVWFLFIVFGDIFQPHCEHFLFDEYVSNRVQTEHLALKNVSPCNTKKSPMIFIPSQKNGPLKHQTGHDFLETTVHFFGRRWVKYIWLMRVMSWRCVPCHMYLESLRRRPSRSRRCLLREKGMKRWGGLHWIEHVTRKNMMVYD